MSGTIWLIVEGETDTEIVRAILRRKRLSVKVEPIKPSGTKRIGISRLAKQLERLIKLAIEKRQRGDCIAVLHDADLQTRPHKREDYETVKRICARYKNDVWLVEARDTIEAWLLADEGLCRWVGISVQGWDEQSKPKDKLIDSLDRAGKPKYTQRNLEKILENIDGTGDKHSPSMRDALTHLENAPCVQKAD